MKLADWFKQPNADGSKRRKGVFAAAIGKVPSTVTAYLGGSAWPDRETMAKIAQVTAGEVTANDFVETAEAAK
jgi:hypothetical protein